jgi:hypothetical protein
MLLALPLRSSRALRTYRFAYKPSMASGRFAAATTLAASSRRTLSSGLTNGVAAEPRSIFVATRKSSGRTLARSLP